MTESADAVRLDVSTDPADVPIPAAVGDRLADLYGAAAVTTAAEWLDALETAVAPTAGDPLGVADLCATDSSPHVLETADGRQAYRCVFDPMVVPFLTGDPGTVRSACPTTDEPVVFDVADGTVEADPETAVFSVGVDPAADGDPPFAPGETYGHVCPYGNVFRDHDAYDAWAAESDAPTAALPLEYGVAVVAGLAERLRGG